MKQDLKSPAYTTRWECLLLVSLLSGRNFETKQLEDEIAKESFQKLKTGIIDAINETHFKRFVMIIRSAGFIDSGMIRSQNALNFAYIV